MVKPLILTSEVQFMQEVRVVDNAVCVAPENVSQNVEVEIDNVVPHNVPFSFLQKEPFLLDISYYHLVGLDCAKIWQ